MRNKKLRDLFLMGEFFARGCAAAAGESYAVMNGTELLPLLSSPLGNSVATPADL